jgi:hypothetical protein
MSSTSLAAGEIDRHLRRMRLTTTGFLLTIPVAVAAILSIPARDGMASPLAVTIVAAGAGLWVGFTANRDAQVRLDRIKRAFAATGDERRLLRDHRMVNLAVLARLEVMVVASVVAAVWGSSQTAAWGVLALAALMMGLSWPTSEKTDRLLVRAREQRGR